jgi:hypothetical protein
VFDDIKQDAVGFESWFTYRDTFFFSGL